ncbi:MAG: DNA helicase RecQ [Clostridia bacterium]|nr:DNA helicase RecQ [Clostridia bacterium]
MNGLTKYDILKKYFGYTSFRGGQEALIDAVLGGRDAFGIMPTGGGKSLCYQIPALMFEGMTLVVSPLISLMQDQVMSLCASGVAAAYLNSSLTPRQIRRVWENMAMGKYKIVYVAPERLETAEFLALAQQLPITFLAVDEAHCISQWGQDFRPSYLKILTFLEALPRRPVLAAFTATATEAVREDIVRILGLRRPLQIVTGFDRPNLNFEVAQPPYNMPDLRRLMERFAGKSGIIYCTTRNNVEKVCASLIESGLPATRYHAGLTDEERHANQEDFIYDRRPIMVATNAFGMGIDKSNVSYVIHYNMPLSLEAYYQEAGRAGRDGEAADCVLLFAPGDLHTANMLIESSRENEELSEEELETILFHNRRRLDQMVGYCKTTGCLRAYILSYFGQPSGERCGNCGNCRTEFAREDITVQAQMILSCTRRVRTYLGYPVGKVMIAKILLGSADKRIGDLGLDTLPTYGLMKDLPSARVRDMIDFLIAEGFLYVNSEHGGMTATDAADAVLFHEKRVYATFKPLPEKEKKTKERRSRGKRGAVVVPTEIDEELYNQLKRLRMELSLMEKVPPYLIFSNATLADMAARKPCTLDEFLTISGVGESKAARYGDIFHSAIAEYLINEV